MYVRTGTSNFRDSGNKSTDDHIIFLWYNSTTVRAYLVVPKQIWRVKIFSGVGEGPDEAQTKQNHNHLPGEGLLT